MGIKTRWYKGRRSFRDIVGNSDAVRIATSITPVILVDKDEQELPRVREKVHALELRIGDKNNAIVAYSKVFRLAHVAESISRLSKGTHELHLGIEDLYARIHHIRHKESAVFGSGNARWEVELSGVVADTSDALQQSTGRSRVHMNFMDLDVGHKQFVQPNGDGYWPQGRPAAGVYALGIIASGYQGENIAAPRISDVPSAVVPHSDGHWM